MSSAALAGLVLALAPAAQAAVYTWIGGASTNWNLTDANWDAGGGATTWVNGNDAVFTSGFSLANTAGITANSVLTSGGMVITGSTLTMVGDAKWTTNTAQDNIRVTLAGSAGLTKLGNNIMRLERDNSYTGNTTVSAGTLRFNIATLGNGTSPGTYAGNIHIANGATLSYERGVQTFNGIISGTGLLRATDSQSSRFLTLGGVNTFTGDIKVGNSLTLSSTGSLLFDIDGNGVNNQIIYESGAGDLNLFGAFAFDLSGADESNLTNTWNILTGALDTTYDSNFSVTGFNSDGGAAGSRVWSKDSTSAKFLFSEATGILSLDAIPEPSSMILFGTGLIGLLGIRRRK